MKNNTDEKHINDLVDNCLSFVDKRGRIVSKSNTGVSTSLEMKYDVDNLAFHFSVYSHCMGNGSCYVQVKKDKKVVFEANGCFTVRAFGMKAEVYQPGDWEKTIPEWCP
ncbi:hypothetical protein HY772_05960 [Candidatus Woesearchaeota archaeon]|nr:hypothetical protein [Candidatus Woesearchaeota archaeon]